MCHGEVRLQFQCPAVAGDRFVQFPLVFQCIAQVVVRFSQVGFEAEGLLILPHGCRQLALGLEDIAQVEVCFDIVRFETDGLLVLRHRFNPAAPWPEGQGPDHNALRHSPV